MKQPSQSQTKTELSVKNHDLYAIAEGFVGQTIQDQFGKDVGDIVDVFVAVKSRRLFAEVRIAGGELVLKRLA